MKKKRKKILITIDEVANNQNMRHFASEFQIYVRNDLPVYLIMTGLYENIDAVQNDPALTFLLRSPKIRLGPLSIGQITKQYASIFQIEYAEANHLAVITKGYAFAFQALGMLFFEYRDSLDLEDILSKLDDMLDDFVYRKIWESLSQQDKEVAKALTEQPIKVKEVCEKLSMTSAGFSRYRDRLMRKGIILSPQHGYVVPALPRFTDVIRAYE